MNMQGGDEVGSIKLSSLSLSSKTVVIGKSVTAFNRATMENKVERFYDLTPFSFQEKPHCIRKNKIHNLPYRIPTQVGRSSRLRRSGEK